jgi:hypothetical protein
MIMNSIEELQPAIVTKLKSDAALMAKVTGVFDDVEQGQKFPFIQVSAATETPKNTFGRKGRESTITIDVFSRYKGFKESLQIYSLMDQLLDGVPLDLSTFQLVFLQNDGMNMILGPDGKTRHIPVKYRAFIQE